MNDEEEKITKKIWLAAIFTGAFTGIALAAIVLFFYLPSYFWWLRK